MLKNPFELIFEVVNDPEDFKIPYKIYGQVDLEIMTDKYNRLTNSSKHPLIQRYKQR
jgi:hypothetical protein